MLTEDVDEVDTEHDLARPPIDCRRTLGRYVLCNELASGGMATVYLARADGPGGFGKMELALEQEPQLKKLYDEEKADSQNRPLTARVSGISSAALVAAAKSVTPARAEFLEPSVRFGTAR